MVILREVFVFREERALVRLLDIIFECHQAFLARLLQQFINHFQGIDVALGAELRGPKCPNEPAHHLLQNVYWIGDQQRAQRRPADDDQLRRLEQHLDVAVLHQVARHDAAENYHDPNDRKHGTSSSHWS